MTESAFSVCDDSLRFLRTISACDQFRSAFRRTVSTCCFDLRVQLASAIGFAAASPLVSPRIVHYRLHLSTAFTAPFRLAIGFGLPIQLAISIYDLDLRLPSALRFRVFRFRSGLALWMSFAFDYFRVVASLHFNSDIFFACRSYVYGHYRHLATSFISCAFDIGCHLSLWFSSPSAWSSSYACGLRSISRPHLLSVCHLRSVSLSLSFDEKLRDTHTITRISLDYSLRHFAQLRLSY
jgi:hypothetical protein